MSGPLLTAFRVTLVVLPAFALMRSEAISATLDAPKGSCLWTLSGQIRAGDRSALESRLRKTSQAPDRVCSSQGVAASISLKSEGGDPDEAMAIGQLIRNSGIATQSERCYSSCVLIHLAGVKRSSRWSPDAIGVHRMYWVALARADTYETASASRQRQLTKVRDYIARMGASATLLDLMEATPPESMRMLSHDERVAYLVDGVDPIWEELRVAERAAFFGLSSAEFRRRRLLGESQCGDGSSLKPDDVIAQSRCETAIFWGIPVAKMLAASSAVSAKCGPYDDSKTRTPTHARWVECVRRVLSATP